MPLAFSFVSAGETKRIMYKMSLVKHRATIQRVQNSCMWRIILILKVTEKLRILKATAQNITLLDTLVELFPL